MLRGVTKRFSISGAAAVLLFGMLSAGCSTVQQQVGFKLPPLHTAVPEVPIADVDVVELTPAMEAFLDRYVMEYPNPDTRLSLLLRAVTRNGALGFDYDESLTLTAPEAFNMRAGNCIGFSNLIVTLARRAGLKAVYHEVFRRPEWSSRDDTVLLIKHVNVIVESKRYTYVVDASGLKLDPDLRQRVIGDAYAKALYLNNLGAEALLSNDLPTAYAYLRKAIETEPQITDAWINLGVVFNRNGQLDSAEQVLQRALQLDRTAYSAMGNLYEVYLAQGNVAAAEALREKVEKYRSTNPYYLLKLSDEALALNQFDESIDLLQKAIRKKDNDHLLYFALAKTQYLSGETSAAQNSLAQALELAPLNKVAYYSRPLSELMVD